MAIRKLRNWFWVDFRANGQRYRKKSPANTKASAHAFEATLRQKLSRGESLDDKENVETPTFEQFSRDWFDTYVKTNNKPTEQRSKESTLRVHLVPFFGTMKLDRITTADIERFKAAKLRSKLLNKSINNFLTTFSCCLNCAVDWEVLEKSPKIKKLRPEPRTFDYLDEKESARLLSDISEPIWHAMIVLALHTGMRIGEILALSWKDLNFKHRQITVRRTYTEGFLSSPKSHRIRYIPMSSDVISSLKEIKRTTKFVFQGDVELPVSYGSATAALRRICKRTHVRRVRWHVMRHTFASHLVSKGVPLRAIQILLGHSSIVMTERYAHLAPSMLTEAISTLEQPCHDEIKNFGHYMVNARDSKEENHELVESRNPLTLEKNSIVAGGGFEPPT